jgi:hypothetical protein
MKGPHKNDFGKARKFALLYYRMPLEHRNYYQGHSAAAMAFKKF